jgi:hypothetical protein
MVADLAACAPGPQEAKQRFRDWVLVCLSAMTDGGQRLRIFPHVRLDLLSSA